MKKTDMAKGNNSILREAAKAAQMGYYDHLSAGGKGDPAEERWIEALNAGADAITKVSVLESLLAQIDDGILALFGTYSQLSKALCGKENAKSEELLQEANQLKDRPAQAERERDVALEELKACDWYEGEE